MRLTTIIVIASLMQVSAATFGQRITIDKRNTSIENILKEIRKQSGYSFIYDVKTLSNAQKINISVNDVTVEDALKTTFYGLDLNYEIDGKIVSVKKKEKSLVDKIVDYFAQIDIRGKVLDADGNPLPGASVKVKGTGQATVTDNNGNFILSNVAEDAAIEIAFIGYQTLTVKAKAELGSMRLALSVEKLQEITVSTGYQTLLKERAPGAFSSINRDELDKRPVANLSTALAGMVAGVQAKENADGSMQLLVRGNSSLYADRSPLLIVDGFPISETDFSSINPNDVENITVLKDAAAASIWGAKSGNGVIVITTKRNTKRNKGIHIEGSVFTRVAKLTDLDQVLTQAGSADQVAYERMAFNKGWFFSPYAGSFTDVNKPLTLAQELLYANKNGKLSLDKMNASLDSLSRISNRNQIEDLLMRRAMLSQYNVSFTGASDRSNTYASLLAEDSKTRFKGSQYKRYNLNFAHDYKLTRFLSFNFGLNLQYRDNESSGATIEEMQGLSPYETLLQPNGSYSVNLNNRNREQLALLPLNRFPYADWNYNLLREVNNRKFGSEDINARLNAGFNVKLIKGLTFDTKVQYEQRRVDISNYYGEETYFARDLINSTLEYNNTTKTVGRVFIPKGGIEASRRTDMKSYVFRNQLSFDSDFSTRHHVNAIAGMEISQAQLNTRNNPWQYGYFPEKLTSTVPVYGYGSSVDLFTNFQGFSTTLSGGNTVLGYNLDRYVSYYANAAYTYNRKYTFSASVRADASNFITDDPALRWSPLWSVGALWNIRSEDFMKNADFVNHLNLRITYGRNGNVEKSSSTRAIISVSTSPSTTTGTLTATITDNGNPSLRWEKTTTTNVGLDFSLLGQKLNGKIDLYRKIGTDITGLIALPAAAGTTSQRFNNAGITNKGIEIELGTNLQLPAIPVTWVTSFNYAYNKNYVNDLFSPVTLTAGYLDPAFAFVQGRAINPVYSFTYAGMVNGIPQVVGPNGVNASFNSTTAFSSNAGLTFLNYEGTLTPPHTLGWFNTFRYKNFSLSALLMGKMGGVYRSPAFNYSAYVGSNKTFVNKFVADVLAGRSDIPGFANTNEGNLYLWDRYVPYLSSLIESSSYVEFKELMIDYALPQKISSKIGAQNFKVFAQVRDLGLIWTANKNSYHPDWLPGTDRPLTTYTFGVNFKF